METPQPQESMAFEIDDVEDISGPYSSQNSKNSYCISRDRGWVIVNTAQGFFIVENNKIRKFYEKESPFRGKAGVKMSCMLPNSNLIAVVPDKQQNVMYDVTDTAEEIQSKRQSLKTTITVRPNTVYIYDIVSLTIIYSKCFNQPIQNIKISNVFIAVSNNKRVVIFKYRDAIQKMKNKEQLQRLIEGYKKGNFDKSARYIEVDSNIPIEFSMSEIEPIRLAFIKKSRDTLYVYDSDLDIFMNVPMKSNQTAFCLSPDGKYVALITDGCTNIRIIEVDTRELFSQLYRGNQSKDLACVGFCDQWINLASKKGPKGTFHIFPFKKGQPNEVISSRFKRYFNTYNESADFVVKDGKVTVFSLAGLSFQALDLERAKLVHGQDASFVVGSHHTTAWT